MSYCPFCNIDDEPADAIQSSRGTRTARFLSRTWRGIQWFFPATLFVLIPKCPMCVVGYIATFTGIGVTMTTGEWIRRGLLAICFASLALLVVRQWRRFARTRQMLAVS